MGNFIKIKKSNVLRVPIIDENDIETGEYLEFDLEDIELPFKYQECVDSHRKNVNYLKQQFIIINKKQDVKGEKLLSRNEEEKLKIINEFYKREIQSFDLFVGEGGTKKLLNGRKPYYSMFDDFSEMLEPILPQLEQTSKNIENKIKEKYAKVETNVLE